MRTKIKYTEAIKKYGTICNGTWSNEGKWMVRIKIPDDISRVWLNSFTHEPTIQIYVNKDMAGPLIKALQNIVERGLLDELHTFDGCFSIRDVRGCPGSPSCHSYGLAIDINARENPLGGVPKFSPHFVKCFTDEGFSWGGNFKRPDPMHYSLGWE